MVTKKAEVLAFSLVDGKKLTAEQTRQLKEALAKAKIKADATIAAKTAHFNANTEDAMYNAYNEYGDAMAAVATLAASFGVTIQVDEPVEGYKQHVGANSEGTDRYHWIPSSVCW